MSYRNDLIRYVMWFGKLDLIAAEGEKHYCGD